MKEVKNLDALEVSRDKVIVRASVVGIIANIFLAAFKAAVGLISNSIAVVLDAVNNLSDALSSVITIIGTHMANRRADKEHPFGHGRVEYLSAMVVAALVLYAGGTSLVESVKKIISPEAADYSMASLIIIASAVVVKIILGRYVKSVGEKVNSGALVASGSDAMFDAIISASVLLSALIFILWGISLEAYVGVIISIVIIKAGIEMMTDTYDEIVGKRVDRETVSQIKKTICEEDAVSGAYDLILHSYGPDKYMGSVHIEIPDTMNAEEIDLLERRIAENVFMKHGVALTGIGIYSMNTQNDEIKRIRSEVTRLAASHDGVLQIHGFYADTEKKHINFDVILDFAVDDRAALFEHIVSDVKEAFPDYEINATMDIDI